MQKGAWWVGSAHRFQGEDLDSLATSLKARAAKFSISPDAHRAWNSSLGQLRDALDVAGRDLSATVVHEWGLLLEYQIPRRAIRPDLVVLLGSTIVVIEFKGAAVRYERADQMQVTEYAATSPTSTRSPTTHSWSRSS